MNRFFASLATLAFTLTGLCPAPAQTINVRTLALRAEDMPRAYIKGPKDFVPLRFSSVQPGKAVRALAANPLPIYRTEVDAKGKAAHVVADQVNLPVGARGILLLGWSGGGKARYIAVKDDFAAAKYNDWLLINTCSRPVAFKVGEKSKPILLKPGTSTTYRITVAKGEGASVLAQAPFNGKDTIFFSTYWPVYSGKRSVVLFVDDGPKIIARRISDKLTKAGSGENSG